MNPFAHTVNLAGRAENGEVWRQTKNTIGDDIGRKSYRKAGSNIFGADRISAGISGYP